MISDLKIASSKSHAIVSMKLQFTDKAMIKNLKKKNHRDVINTSIIKKIFWKIFRVTLLTKKNQTLFFFVLSP